MAAFDAATTAQFDNAMSVTFSHTPVGTPTAVTVGVASSNVPSGVTYGGTDMGSSFVSATNATTGMDVTLRGLASPAAGAQDVVISFAAGTWGVAGSVTATASDPTTCFRAGSGASDTTINGNSTDAITAGATGDLAIDCIGWRTDFSKPLTSGQTNRWSIENTGDSEAGNGSTAAGGASVTMSYTTAAGNYTALVCASIQDAAAAGGHPTVKRFGGVNFAHRIGGGQMSRSMRIW